MKIRETTLLEWLTKPAKSYRRARFEKRYDSPLLFLVVDFAIGMVKLILVICLLLIIWVIASRYTGTPNPSLTQSTDSANIGGGNEIKSPDMISARAEATQVRVASQIQEHSPATSEEDKPVFQLGSRRLQSDKTNVLTIVNQQWVLEQSSDIYTIQFRTSPDAEILRQFAPDIGSETPVSIFPFKKSADGQVVFGIASGLYENMQDAKAAIEIMTPAAREYGPWIRPLDVLQREISDTVTDPPQ